MGRTCFRLHFFRAGDTRVVSCFAAKRFPNCTNSNTAARVRSSCCLLSSSSSFFLFLSRVEAEWGSRNGRQKLPKGGTCYGRRVGKEKPLMPPIEQLRAQDSPTVGVVPTNHARLWCRHAAVIPFNFRLGVKPSWSLSVSVPTTRRASYPRHRKIRVTTNVSSLGGYFGRFDFQPEPRRSHFPIPSP